MSQITIQRLNPAHAEDYRALMLEAYERHPDDFSLIPALAIFSSKYWPNS